MYMERRLGWPGGVECLVAFDIANSHTHVPGARAPC